jgi:hypothetical protein
MGSMETGQRVSKDRLRRTCRGRPKKSWSLSKQQKLVRLYLCISNEKLPLVHILQLLKDDKFDPK